MELKFKIFLICLCLVFAIFIYKKIEKGKIQLKYSLSWYLVTFMLILATIFDELLIPLKNFFGFETTSNMIFLFGFLILIMIVFSLNVKISDLTAKNTKLTQEVALLKKEMSKNGNNK